MRYWRFPDETGPRYDRRGAWATISEPDERLIAAVVLSAAMTLVAAWLIAWPMRQKVQANPRAMAVALLVRQLPQRPPPAIPEPPLTVPPWAPDTLFAAPRLSLKSGFQAASESSLAGHQQAATRSVQARIASTAAPTPHDAALMLAQSAPAVRDVSMETRYAAALRETIERHKRNPETVGYRMLHPHGTAVVAFPVTRAGLAGAPRVVASSGSGMLDAQAVLIVTECRFPPMPAKAFAGETVHEFQVEITFPPFQGAA